MVPFGVVVEYSQAGTDPLSCSGVHLGRGLVLTHGTIILDVLKKDSAATLHQALLDKGFVSGDTDSDLFSSMFGQSKLLVLFPRDGKESSCLEIQEEQLGLDEVIESNNDSRHESYRGEICAVFTQEGITRDLSQLMPASQGWRLTEEKSEEWTARTERLLVSTFVVVRAKNYYSDGDTESASLAEVVKEVMSYVTACTKGSGVYIESSPFGSLCPGVFLNCVSCGVASNVSGGGSVVLTDARCVMGAEGAPVFIEGLDRRKRLGGLVISPFCWHRGEWLGLTIVAAAAPLMSTLLRHADSHQDPTRPLDLHPPKDKLALQEPIPRRQLDVTMKSAIPNETFSVMLKKTLLEAVMGVGDECVVGVGCGGGWGSGVVVSRRPGVVLTCAHVTAPAMDGEVQVWLKGRSVAGRVVHQTEPHLSSGVRGASVWDLAVVVTRDPLPAALPLATTLPPRGWPVMVVGHGVFSPSSLPSPSSSLGVVSKVVRVPASTLRIPTTTPPPSPHAILDRRRVTVNVAREHLASHQLKPNANNSSVNKHWACVDIGEDDAGSVAVMLQTTCAVYSGTSGGAVLTLHPEKGLQVLGVVVCNTRDAATHATFPHINLAVPAPPIAHALNNFIRTADPACLAQLDVESPSASKLWSLGLLPKPKL